MRKLSVASRRALEERDDDWVQKARELTKGLKDEKERQLRNIQHIAEASESWKAVALFIRYQAARNQLDKAWAEEAVAKLEALQNNARSLAGKDDPKSLHMELVSRVLGYAVRWHVWDIKNKEKSA